MNRRPGYQTVLWVSVTVLLLLGGTSYAYRNKIQEEYWIWKLRHGEEQEVATAADSLSRMRSRAAIPYLLQINRWWLENRKAECTYCRAAVIGMGSAAIPVLIDLLKSPTENDRLTSLIWLREIDHEAYSAIPAIFDAFKHAIRDEQAVVELHAMSTLDAFAHDSIDNIHFLINALNDDSPQVRELAVRLLSYFAKVSQDAQRAIKERLNDPDQDVKNSASRLMKDIENSIGKDSNKRH